MLDSSLSSPRWIPEGVEDCSVFLERDEPTDADLRKIGLAHVGVDAFERPD